MQLAAFETRGSPGGTSQGNTVQLRSDPDALLDEILALIQGAERRVWLEVYILDSDSTGVVILQELAHAAMRGCSVRLLLDGWGGRKLKPSATRQLVAAGGVVSYYNPISPWRRPGRRLGSPLHRDHRKILLIDDIAFVGGRNISNEYLGKHPLFLDLNVRLEGPSVYHVATLLSENWGEVTGAPLVVEEATAGRGDGVEVSIIELDQRLGYPDLDVAIRGAMDATQRTCRIITPYFVPPQWFLQSLALALERGVDVQILTAGRSDVPMARSAGRHLYDDLIESGARIFEMHGLVLHAKSIIFDDDVCIVGSYNIDAYGSRHNLELGVAVSSKRFTDQLQMGWLEAVGQSMEIDQARWSRRGIVRRMANWLSYKLYRI